MDTAGVDVSSVKCAGWESSRRERIGVRRRYDHSEPAGDEMAPTAQGKGYIYLAV